MPVLERMVRAVEKVRNRLLRLAAALEKAGVPYAVIGGNAVAAWVATVDESAVRNTQDVDVLLDRKDFSRVTQALEAAGFIHQNVAGVDLFLDGPAAGPRDSVHVVFAGEKVRPHYDAPAPDLHEAHSFPLGMKVLGLDALVRMKLTSFRWKDRMHLLDLVQAGLLGEDALPRLSPALAARLREVLENPEG
ncbi:MAG: nucleotidyltransferase family protein [Pirellulales bacterium]|nr:nucleotidyltransferase family protein [Pirellulales bacterium]